MEPGLKGNQWLLIGGLVLVVALGALFFMNRRGIDEAKAELSPEEELEMKHRVLEELAAVSEEENARENPAASAAESETADIETGPTEGEKFDVLKALRAE